ncbi:ANTAR domain-containing protein [Actinokineospora diospyrosa]|uniref:GAF domain-containing protein n=1 Tax=Actinokineospora diospyrosa TaxID=103728 RepID=A0ABT1I6S3_9PSEU|nr:ANTAR domain-containing protein [Actinokineospora diospyrosa]MCP2268316.1 GAF domain-containing protein [Actinokineospora diospyrosa]
MATRARLAEVLIELSDTLAIDFALLPYLRQLAAACAEFADADATAVLLADGDGTLRSTDPLPGDERLSDLFDRQCAHGPGAIAFHTGADVAGPVSDWPGFADTAAAAGLAHAHGVPMRLRGATVGAVCLYRVADRPFDAEAITAVHALADMAALGISTERALRQRQTLAEQLQAALDTRVLIEQAKGVLAERGGVEPTESFRQLRTLARTHNMKIAQVAEEVVRSAARGRLRARG